MRIDLKISKIRNVLKPAFFWKQLDKFFCDIYWWKSTRRRGMRTLVGDICLCFGLSGRTAWTHNLSLSQNTYISTNRYEFKYCYIFFDRLKIPKIGSISRTCLSMVFLVRKQHAGAADTPIRHISDGNSYKKENINLG